MTTSLYITKSYNASTGVLSVQSYVHGSSNSGIGASAALPISIYIIR